MSNSSLVSCTMLSPNHSGKRKSAIDRITIHCVVGQLSAESIGNCFKLPSRNASCNYGIGREGRVVLVVDEANRSWCSSSSSNDNRAVTIECASDLYSPYAFNSVVFDKLVDLCVDICKRNGKSKLLWIDDKYKALAYKPKDNEMLITVHRWFANKECPGNWLMSKMGILESRVNKKLYTHSTNTSTSFLVKIKAKTLNVMKGAGSNYNVVKKVKKNDVYTIVEVKGKWGKLKSGIGWINISSSKVTKL